MTNNLLKKIHLFFLMPVLLLGYCPIFFLGISPVKALTKPPEYKDSEFDNPFELPNPTEYHDLNYPYYIIEKRRRLPNII